MRNESAVGQINYALVLQIIRSDDDPAEALRAFVGQERENAAHEERAAWVAKVEALADAYDNRPHQTAQDVVASLRALLSSDATETPPT